jgi:hypothetical protein
MILTAFGDETGTHDDGPVMMLGGHVARLMRLNSFNAMSRRSLSRAGLLYWHGTGHWGTEAGAKFAPIAQKLVKKDLLFGYVVELDKGPYQDAYLAGGPNKPQLDTRCGVCFRFLAAFLFTRLPGLIGRNDFVVNFLLEDGAVGSADRKQPLRDMKKQSRRRAPTLGEVEFGDKKKDPGYRQPTLSASVPTSSCRRTRK